MAATFSSQAPKSISPAVYGEVVIKPDMTPYQTTLKARYEKARSAFERACQIARKSPKKNFYLLPWIKLDEFMQAQLDFEVLHLLKYGLQISPCPPQDSLESHVFTIENQKLAQQLCSPRPRM